MNSSPPISYRTFLETPADYRGALETACREYEQLSKQRADIDARIAQLIGNLSRLCGFTPTVALGMTDACRMVLKAAGHPLSALEMRAHLETMGMDLSKYTNDLAAIHTTLKRLSQSGEVAASAHRSGKPAYRWNSQRAPVASLAAASRAVTKQISPRRRKK
jgi:hypothetical protein